MMQNIGNDVNQVKINSLSKIQGQPDVVKVLYTNLEAFFNARATAKPQAMPSISPIFLAGPSGCGKSLVAQALHCELGNLNTISPDANTIFDNQIAWVPIAPVSSIAAASLNLCRFLTNTDSSIVSFWGRQFCLRTLFRNLVLATYLRF
jgi:hypothetical protein